MRLVKAAALFACLAACKDPPQAPPPADCRMILVEPAQPRLARIEPDGALVDEGPCTSVICVAGSDGVWGRRDGRDLLVTLGDRSERVTLPAHGNPAFPAFGALFGRDLAAVEDAGGLRLLDGRGLLPAHAAFPTLAAREHVVGLWRTGPRARLVVDVEGEDRARVVELTAATGAPAATLRTALDSDGNPVAELVGEPPSSVRFRDGSTVPFTAPEEVVLPAGHGDVVVLYLRHGALWIRKDGTVRTVPRDVLVLRTVDDLWRTFDPATRVLADADGRTVLAPDAGHDIGGAPLPGDGTIARVRTAAGHDKLLVVERVQSASCTVEDRVHVVDLATGAVKDVARGEGMRLHATYAGDRFRLVTATPRYSAP